jgi:hypothetical protein
VVNCNLILVPVLNMSIQRVALQIALTSVLQQSDLVGRCDRVLSQASRGPDAMQEDHEGYVIQHKV